MESHEIELRYWAAMAVVREAGELAADFYRRRDELEVERKGTQDLRQRGRPRLRGHDRRRIGRLFPGRRLSR